VNCRSECVKFHNLVRLVVAPIGGGQKNRSVCFDLSSAAFSSGVPRKNHTKETRHLAGPIRDVGCAGRREVVCADLRRYGFGEP